jgi:hypothetical protein
MIGVGSETLAPPAEAPRGGVIEDQIGLYDDGVRG